MRWRIVAVADNGIHILSASHWDLWRPKRLLRTLPRKTQLGPVDGIWAKLQLGPERTWVNWYFFDDVREADTQRPHSGANTPDRIIKPADEIIESKITWVAQPNKRDHYFANVDGTEWVLHVDEAPGGIRYILLRNRKYVREVAYQPNGWTIP